VSAIPVVPILSLAFWEARNMSQSHNITVEELIRVLSNRPSGLHIEQLADVLWQARHGQGPTPKNFRAAIYFTLSHYTSQSTLFRQKRRNPVHDLFYSPDGKGSGTWAVSRARAEAWLNSRLSRLRLDRAA
jgi:hypothetical protein